METIQFQTFQNCTLLSNGEIVNGDADGVHCLDKFVDIFGFGRKREYTLFEIRR